MESKEKIKECDAEKKYLNGWKSPNFVKRYKFTNLKVSASSKEDKLKGIQAQTHDNETSGTKDQINIPKNSKRKIMHNM